LIKKENCYFSFQGSSTAPPPKQVDFSSQTIPELIYTRAESDRVAVVFDAEKVSFTFAKMETLAAGFLSIGLVPGDRILICGSNHSQVFFFYHFK
uniref:AMP-binding domain-containing protein n=1 Tax=Angiostrongylus cantonensis TaxID=6313 RepID=A0A0K0DF46_ANGCA